MVAYRGGASTVQINRKIEIDTYVGEIERLEAGALIGWLCRTGNHAPVSIVVASEWSHTRATASLARPDVLFRHGHHEHCGFGINLGALAAGDTVDTMVRVFCEESDNRLLVAELSLPTAVLAEGRHRVEMRLSAGRVLEGFYTTSDNDSATPPKLLLRNAEGNPIELKVGKGPSAAQTIAGQAVWQFRCDLRLSFVAGKLPLTLFSQSHSGEQLLASTIDAGLIYAVTANSKSVSGWALAAADPAHRVLVTISDLTGRMIERGRATSHRPDLMKLTGLDGFFGFQFPRPPDQDVLLEMSAGNVATTGPLLLRSTSTTAEAMK